jgi:hypothetical protein
MPRSIVAKARGERTKDVAGEEMSSLYLAAKCKVLMVGWIKSTANPFRPRRGRTPLARLQRLGSLNGL